MWLGYNKKCLQHLGPFEWGDDLSLPEKARTQMNKMEIFWKITGVLFPWNWQESNASYSFSCWAISRDASCQCWRSASSLNLLQLLLLNVPDLLQHLLKKTPFFIIFILLVLYLLFLFAHFSFFLIIFFLLLFYHFFVLIPSFLFCLFLFFFLLSFLPPLASILYLLKLFTLLFYSAPFFFFFFIIYTSSRIQYPFFFIHLSLWGDDEVEILDPTPINHEAPALEPSIDGVWLSFICFL